MSNSYDLTYIHPNDVQSYWDLVKLGLEAVKENATDGWIQEDVYYALKSGYSTLHMGYMDQEYVGFVILTPLQGYDVKKLHIWCAYNRGERELLEIFLPEIEQMAKNIGAKKLQFASPRNWVRRLPNFKAVTTYYEKEV